MKKWTILIVIIIALAASGAGIYASGYFDEDETEPELRIEMGDIVKVHYTGWLEDDRIYDARRIFDTSRSQIPEQTTLTFDERTRGEPFQFEVGRGVIEGWSEYLIGVKEGETINVFIPPEKAYDTRTDDLVFSIPKSETLPVYDSMLVEEFRHRYESTPSANMIATDPFWGWNVRVMSVEGNRVYLKNEPIQGELYNAYKQEGAGWRSRVVSIDSTAAQGAGEIVLEHIVERGTVVDFFHIGWHNKDIAQVDGIRMDAGQSHDNRGIVVDVSGDTITVDFNEEVAGKTLQFRVTVLEIQKQD